MGGVGGKYTTGGSVEAVTKTEVTPTGKQTSLSSGSHPDNTPSTQGTSKGRIGLLLAGDVTIVGSMGTSGKIAQSLSRFLLSMSPVLPRFPMILSLCLVVWVR